MGYSSWGCKESDTIGRLTLTNAHRTLGAQGGQAGVQPQGPCSQHRGERLLAHFGFSCRQQPQLS